MPHSVQIAAAYRSEPSVISSASPAPA
jgi:hypothetical protein